MTDKEIMALLRKERKENERILKELVEKRVSKTAKEKFSIQEIHYYSNYFKIDMSKLLLQILSVKDKDYKKFTKGEIKHIYSEKFSAKKEKLIRKVKNIYKYRVNWNKKNYYNKQKLLEKANNFNINALDFATGVLQKTSISIKRVLKDKTYLKRFYIGQNVNTSLPMEYVDKNLEELQRIAECAVRKVIYKMGIRLSKDEFNEEVQKCLVYALDNGNSLNKNSEPVIHSTEFKKRQGKTIYQKVYCYEMAEIGKLRYDFEYDEEFNYRNRRWNYIDEEHEVNNFIDGFALNDSQAEIIRLINDGYSKDEIVAQKEISLDSYDEIIEEIKFKILEDKIA